MLKTIEICRLDISSSLSVTQNFLWILLISREGRYLLFPQKESIGSSPATGRSMLLTYQIIPFHRIREVLLAKMVEGRLSAHVQQIRFSMYIRLRIGVHDSYSALKMTTYFLFSLISNDDSSYMYCSLFLFFVSETCTAKTISYDVREKYPSRFLS